MLTVALLGTFLRFSASLELDEEFNFEAGYEITFNCIQQVPMLLMLSVHHSRRSHLLSEDKIEFSPKVPSRDFKDAFGNICSRLVAPPVCSRSATSSSSPTAVCAV
jgi:hypothetical protein